RGSGRWKWPGGPVRTGGGVGGAVEPPVRLRGWILPQPIDRVLERIDRAQEGTVRLGRVCQDEVLDRLRERIDCRLKLLVRRRSGDIVGHFVASSIVPFHWRLTRAVR